MCVNNYCPCVGVDQSIWGDRSIELVGRNFTGTYYTFDQCYTDLLTQGIVSS